MSKEMTVQKILKDFDQFDSEDKDVFLLALTKYLETGKWESAIELAAQEAGIPVDQFKEEMKGTE